MKKELEKLPFNQPIFWAFIGGISFIAILFGVAIGTSEVEPIEPEIKEKIVEKKIEVCSNESKYRELVDLDSELLGISGQALVISADSMTAIATMDVDRVNSNTAKMEALQPQIKTLTARRLELINELR